VVVDKLLGVVVDLFEVDFVLNAKRREKGLEERIPIVDGASICAVVGAVVGLGVVGLSVVALDILSVEAIVLSVGGVVGGGGHEVSPQFTVFDGQLDQDVRDNIVLELVLVDIETVEEIGKGLLVIAIVDKELSVINGSPNLDAGGEVLEALVYGMELS